jgi:hypothetical protein
MFSIGLSLLAVMYSHEGIVLTSHRKVMPPVHYKEICIDPSFRDSRAQQADGQGSYLIMGMVMSQTNILLETFELLLRHMLTQTP